MLTVITLTGARHEGFALLSKCLARQDYTSPVRWIIVDDCDPMTPVPKMPGNWIIDLIRPSEKWSVGMNTQARNMRQALSVTPDDAVVLFCEDDDHYSDTYLSTMAAALETSEMAGVVLSRKYNLSTRRAKEVIDTRMCSLCCTGVRGRALSLFRLISQRGPRLMDRELWRRFKGRLVDGEHVVSLKCVPGRAGIDSGHAETFGHISDPSGDVLRAWIGDDANDYLSLVPIAPRQRAMIRPRSSSTWA